MSDSVKAALYRFVGAGVALGGAIAIVVYVPDPSLKVLGGALAAAAVLAIEELLKTRDGV